MHKLDTIKDNVGFVRGWGIFKSNAVNGKSYRVDLNNHMASQKTRFLRAYWTDVPEGI